MSKIWDKKESQSVSEKQDMQEAYRERDGEIANEQMNKIVPVATK